jgi:hypothetical protein
MKPSPSVSAAVRDLLHDRLDALLCPQEQVFKGKIVNTPPRNHTITEKARCRFCVLQRERALLHTGNETANFRWAQFFS